MSTPRFLISAAVLIALDAATGFAATPGWTYMAPKLATGEVEIHKACVMPVEAKLSKLGMKGHEGMSKEADDWSSALQEVAETHLKASGVDVLPGGMSPEDLAKNEELQQVVVRLQARYDAISTQLAKHPKDTRKARFTVGDEVSLLPCTAHADTLIYVHGSGQVLTGGKKAFGILVGGASASTASMTLSLVDAKSGDVLAYMHLMNSEKFVKDTEKAYGSRLDKLFKQMKIGTTGQKK